MKHIVVRPSAERDLDLIFDWIAQDDPDAAVRHVQRLVAAVRRLADFPESGPARPEIGQGARSLVIGRYLALYRIVGDTVEIVRFLHGAREKGGMFDA